MSSRRFVVNASPLIYLPQIDSLHLLKELATEVVAPAAVVAEVRAGRYRQLESPRIETVEWLGIEPDVPVPPEIAGWDLGLGESQVLAVTATATSPRSCFSIEAHNRSMVSRVIQDALEARTEASDNEPLMYCTPPQPGYRDSGAKPGGCRKSSVLVRHCPVRFRL